MYIITDECQSSGLRSPSRVTRAVGTRLRILLLKSDCAPCADIVFSNVRSYIIIFRGIVENRCAREHTSVNEIGLTGDTSKSILRGLVMRMYVRTTYIWRHKCLYLPSMDAIRIDALFSYIMYLKQMFIFLLNLTLIQ